MGILFSNLLLESIFDFGKGSNRKYTNTRICVFSVSGDTNQEGGNNQGDKNQEGDKKKGDKNQGDKNIDQ